MVRPVMLTSGLSSSNLHLESIVWATVQTFSEKIPVVNTLRREGFYIFEEP